MTQVTVVGDYTPTNETHAAIDAALEHVGATATWIGTDVATPSALDGSERVFIAPMSPYKDFEGAVAAIRWARENDVPTIGTCAGFQHMVIEFARNVAGLGNADHAEYGRDGDLLVIDELACSLAGETMDVTLARGSIAQKAFGADHATERYYCRFGLNPRFLPALLEHGLAVSGTDGDGEPRIIELPSRRFYVGTLFVPQVRSAPGSPHPLIEAFVEA
jgi:CTP synthase (UTP-ammonia lyase)